MEQAADLDVPDPSDLDLPDPNAASVQLQILRANGNPNFRLDAAVTRHEQ